MGYIISKLPHNKPQLLTEIIKISKSITHKTNHFTQQPNGGTS